MNYFYVIESMIMIIAYTVIVLYSRIYSSITVVDIGLEANFYRSPYYAI